MRDADLEDSGNGLFKLTGEISFTSAADLWRQSQRLFTAAEENILEIDLAGVKNVDSAGLALLVAWIRLSHRSAKTLRFVHLPSKLVALAKANNLGDLLGLDPHQPQH